MERICLALGARGLVNAQFIVREDGVYLIEVNPRASRTVPFLSKVTGVPMVELAVRIALGATLAELGWADGPASRPALRRGQGARVLDGQAQGRRPVGRAVHAVDRRGHRDRRGPAGRAGEGAAPARRWSRPDGRGRGRGAARAALDRRPRQVAPASTWRGRWTSPATGSRRRPGPGPRCVAAGFDGRARREARRGARRPGEAGDPRADRRGHVRLVVNTPTPRSGAVRDAAEIRHAAIAEGVLCLTAIETAVAAAEALAPDIADEIAKVRPITDWVPMGGRAGRGRSRYRGRSRLTDPSSSRPRRSGPTAPAPPAPRRSTGRATTASASSARPSRPPAAPRGAGRSGAAGWVR